MFNQKNMLINFEEHSQMLINFVKCQKEFLFLNFDFQIVTLLCIF